MDKAKEKRAALANTKKNMRHAFKTLFSELHIPGEVSKKVSIKMRIEATLDSGAKIVFACVEVSGGYPTGTYGLYWILSVTHGPILEIMKAVNLADTPVGDDSYVFSTTSMGLTTPSHHEVSADADFAAIALTISTDMQQYAFPIIEGFDSKPNQLLSHILTPRSGTKSPQIGAGAYRNPFTMCIILMHLAKRTDRLEEIIKAASTLQGFYDFKNKDEAQAKIIDPIAKYFMN
jgi:hypothetical protein